jgi:hypothetical protein
MLTGSTPGRRCFAEHCYKWYARKALERGTRNATGTEDVGTPAGDAICALTGSEALRVQSIRRVGLAPPMRCGFQRLRLLIRMRLLPRLRMRTPKRTRTAGFTTHDSSNTATGTGTGTVTGTGTAYGYGYGHRPRLRPRVIASGTGSGSGTGSLRTWGGNKTAARRPLFVVLPWVERYRLLSTNSQFTQPQKSSRYLGRA